MKGLISSTLSFTTQQIKIMKSGSSSLNPHAASYVPLSKRVADHKGGAFEGTFGDCKSSNVTAFSEPLVQFDQGQDRGRAAIHPNFHETSNFPAVEYFSSKSHSAHGSTSRQPINFPDKQVPDEELEMDVEYLQMQFPGLSDQSIADVYLANKGDLDATIDMLSQLEFNLDDFPENLPETLDIGDVAVPTSVAESGYVKLKSVKGEATASSSG